MVESFWHCTVENRGFVFFRGLEKEDRRIRLGTIVFDMIAAADAAVQKMS